MLTVKISSTSGCDGRQTVTFVVGIGGRVGNRIGSVMLVDCVMDNETECDIVCEGVMSRSGVNVILMKEMDLDCVGSSEDVKLVVNE